jgi:hypothetical protein
MYIKRIQIVCETQKLCKGFKIPPEKMDEAADDAWDVAKTMIKNYKEWDEEDPVELVENMPFHEARWRAGYISADFIPSVEDREILMKVNETIVEYLRVWEIVG